MPEITVALLRKRAEHNEGVIATLEEISLHQEELESINELLGATCRKLKILYLQNNIISKMEHLHHLKDLGYLNLALNNIKKIEGLQNCEFLHKLDMTMNFVDVDELEESIRHLQSRERLVDLYMMGNPSQANWPNFQNYVIAMLPQLVTLDGTEITKSMRIIAKQHLAEYEVELRALAAAKRSEIEAKKLAAACIKAEEKGVYEAGADGFDLSEEPTVPEGEEMTENTPETRVEIYRELAQQKKEKEDAAAANLPKNRDYTKEQLAAIEEIRKKEEESGEREVKQKNEGNWDFTWDEDSKPGCVVLEVALPKHLDSSLVDVDVHPTYVSMIVKSKLLRLKIPVEVKSTESSCQRSKLTGNLMVTMPKVNPRETLSMVPKAKQSSKRDSSSASNAKPTASATAKPAKKLSLQEQMAAAAAEAKTGVVSQRLEASGSSTYNATDFRNIVKKKPIEDKGTAATIFQDPSSSFAETSKKSALVEIID